LISLEVVFSSFLGSLLAGLGLLVPASIYLEWKISSLNPFGGGFFDQEEN